jgi:hypothetical protein
MACGPNEHEPIDPVTTKFDGKRHDPSLDQKIQPLLNQYFALIDHLQEKDSADLLTFGTSMIQLTDSLINQNLSLDTATQSRAIQGLINIQYEISAILMESNQNERILGAQMLSLQMIDFLAAIGYQKQAIYIFTNNNESHWIGLKNKSTNPYTDDEDLTYTPSQVLQELK